MPQEQPQTPLVEPMTLTKVLESVPPGRSVPVQNVAIRRNSSSGGHYFALNLSELELYCGGEGCSGVRFFEASKKDHVIRPGSFASEQFFVEYTCRNCRWISKTYALRVSCDETLSGEVYKFGEIPSFGPPTPSRVIKLLGPEKDYYLKGRRAENQGMGVGAFAYYRRVVENQKNRLLDEIIRVAEKIDAPPDMLADLSKAKNETQFSKAVDAMKHGIPSALMVNGHNPLKLLHSALSEGLHAQTDEKCLELASSIRIVLTDLADRLGHALKERAELDAAVSRLMK
jgi:hypothetical protein